MARTGAKRWPRLTNLPLAWEITMILIVKFIVIFAIKKTFFSDPQAKKMLVPMPQVEQHLLSVTPQISSPVTAPDGSIKPPSTKR